jgi:uncharacterized membrane protein YsdA (DUF1294 family)
MALLTLLPLLAITLWLAAHGQPWPGAVYLTASLAAAVQQWRDKRRAERGQWRISEMALHGMELLGGWPGAVCAQQALHHKTRKWHYRLQLWAIIAIHYAAWASWLAR